MFKKVEKESGKEMDGQIENFYQAFEIESIKTRIK